MRTYGRITIPSTFTADSTSITADSSVTADSGAGAGTETLWIEVQTDSNGNNDLVYVTALCQVLLLNLNESPFYASYGIPAQQSVLQQVFPDYYVALTQQLFAPYFASLVITKQPGLTPTYNVRVVTHQGVLINANVPIPK